MKLKNYNWDIGYVTNRTLFTKILHFSAFNSSTRDLMLGSCPIRYVNILSLDILE